MGLNQKVWNMPYIFEVLAHELNNFTAKYYVPGQS